MKNPLPREIVPGIFWLGQCLEQHFQGNVYHAYNAAFLIVGSKSSLLVETGHPGDFSEINRQVKEIALPKKKQDRTSFYNSSRNTSFWWPRKIS